MHLNNRWSYLLNLVFLTGLFVLLCNDFLLKAAWGNALTGKLSDIAGVCILPMFIAFLLPDRKRFALGFTALFFIFWKTELSTPFLDGWNAFIPYSLHRVTDYTDLLVLPVLLLSAKVLETPERFTFMYIQRLPVIRLGVLFLAVFAFGATSHVRYLHGYGVKRVSLNREYTVAYPLDSALAKLQAWPGDYAMYRDTLHKQENKKREIRVYCQMYDRDSLSGDTLSMINLQLSEKGRKKSQVYLDCLYILKMPADSTFFGRRLQPDKEYRKQIEDFFREDVIPK